MAGLEQTAIRAERTTLLVSALSNARGVADEMIVRQRGQVCVAVASRPSVAASRREQSRPRGYRSRRAGQSDQDCPLGEEGAASSGVPIFQID